MKRKVSSLTIRVPHELKEKINKAADNQGISINQFSMYIFAKEVTRLEFTEEENEFKNLKVLIMYQIGIKYNKKKTNYG